MFLNFPTSTNYLLTPTKDTHGQTNQTWTVTLNQTTINLTGTLLNTYQLR